MILSLLNSLLNDILQFLGVIAGFTLGDIAPYIAGIMLGQMLSDDILAILGDKDKRDRILGVNHEQDR